MTDLRRNPRWTLLAGEDMGRDSDPYLDRLRIVGTPQFSLYLHHIHRPDEEPDPHDHPWWFASLVLAGWYEETVWPIVDIKNPITRTLADGSSSRPPIIVRMPTEREPTMGGFTWSPTVP
jgi:hypothetical protein